MNNTTNSNDIFQKYNNDNDNDNEWEVESNELIIENERSETEGTCGGFEEKVFVSGQEEDYNMNTILEKQAKVISFPPFGIIINGNGNSSTDNDFGYSSLRRVDSCYFSTTSETPSLSSLATPLLVTPPSVVAVSTTTPTAIAATVQNLHRDVMMHALSFLSTSSLASFSTTAKGPNVDCFHFLHLRLKHAVEIVDHYCEREKEGEMHEEVEGELEEREEMILPVEDHSLKHEKEEEEESIISYLNDYEDRGDGPNHPNDIGTISITRLALDDLNFVENLVHDYLGTAKAIALRLSSNNHSATVGAAGKANNNSDEGHGSGAVTFHAAVAAMTAARKRMMDAGNHNFHLSPADATRGAAAFAAFIGAASAAAASSASFVEVGKEMLHISDLSSMMTAVMEGGGSVHFSENLMTNTATSVSPFLIVGALAGCGLAKKCADAVVVRGSKGSGGKGGGSNTMDVVVEGLEEDSESSSNGSSYNNEAGRGNDEGEGGDEISWNSLGEGGGEYEVERENETPTHINHSANNPDQDNVLHPHSSPLLTPLTHLEHLPSAADAGRGAAALAALLGAASTMSSTKYDFSSFMTTAVVEGAEKTAPLLLVGALAGGLAKCVGGVYVRVGGGEKEGGLGEVGNESEEEVEIGEESDVFEGESVSESLRSNNQNENENRDAEGSLPAEISFTGISRTEETFSSSTRTQERRTARMRMGSTLPLLSSTVSATSITPTRQETTIGDTSLMDDVAETITILTNNEAPTTTVDNNKEIFCVSSSSSSSSSSLPAVHHPCIVITPPAATQPTPSPRGYIGLYVRTLNAATLELIRRRREIRRTNLSILPEAEAEALTSLFIDSCSSDSGLETVKDVLERDLLDPDMFYEGLDGSETCALHTAAFNGACGVLEYLCSGMGRQGGEGVRRSSNKLRRRSMREIGNGERINRHDGFNADDIEDEAANTNNNNNMEDGMESVMELVENDYNEKIYEQETDGGLCDINVTDANGWTVLHFAAGANCVNAIRLLASRPGIKMTVEASNGYTPYHWAERLSNEEARLELESLGAGKRFEGMQRWMFGERKVPVPSFLANKFFETIHSN